MYRGRGTPVADRVWGQCGEREKAVPTHIRASICCSAPQLFAASSPVVCHSYSQLFAVQHTSYLQLPPTYLQPYPQECAITTPAVCSHHRYLQSPPSCSRSPSQLSAGPPSALYNLFPAVCNHHPSYVQFPSPLWASGKACSRLVLTTTITIS